MTHAEFLSRSPMGIILKHLNLSVQALLLDVYAETYMTTWCLIWIEFVLFNIAN